MDGTHFLTARDLSELHEMLQVLPRGPTCVKCDDQSRLQCPACGKGESCQFTVPIDCSQCPKSYCQADSLGPNSGGGGGGGGPSAGPIAGGVIGGIAAIAVITYLVWRFLIRPKRLRMTRAGFGAQESGPRDAEKDGVSRMARRSSTHTVHSIASTVLTRASNIIQIAYIPGVTNRANPSPNALAPPVPPIPMHHHMAPGQDDQRFFIPGDLRNSTYSGISSYSDRTSYARTSFAPRSSIASTIYGKQAQVLAPAQTGMRAKPTVVSVKSGSGSGPGSGANSMPNTPPVPSIDFDKYNNLRPKSSASTFSVGSTFLNNANTATQARAQVVKVATAAAAANAAAAAAAAGSGLRKMSSGSQPGANTSSTTLGVKTGNGAAPTGHEEVPNPDQGPFSDTPSPVESANSGMDRKSQRGSSPFGDEHATRE